MLGNGKDNAKLILRSKPPIYRLEMIYTKNNDLKYKYELNQGYFFCVSLFHNLIIYHMFHLLEKKKRKKKHSPLCNFKIYQ